MVSSISELMERLIKVIVEAWWFIALLGAITMVAFAPLMGWAIHALGIKKMLHANEVYQTHRLVRLFINHPSLVIALMGLIVLILGLTIGAFK